MLLCIRPIHADYRIDGRLFPPHCARLYREHVRGEHRYWNFRIVEHIANSIANCLGGVSATITDASGKTLPIQLIVVTPGQVNAVLPSGLQSGLYFSGTEATINLTTSAGKQLTGTVELETVAPSLFTADESGGWLAAAQVVIAHADGSQTFIPSIATCTSNLVWNGMTWSGCVPVPINLGSNTDRAVLELYGTGIRGVSSIVPLCPPNACGAITALTAVSVTVGTMGAPLSYSIPLTMLYVDPQAAGTPGSFYGLDQINVALPHSLAGSGVLAIYLSALAGFTADEGAAADANTVYIDIQ